MCGLGNTFKQLVEIDRAANILHRQDGYPRIWPRRL